MEETIMDGTILREAEISGLKTTDNITKLIDIDDLLGKEGKTIHDIIDSHANWVKSGGKDGEQMDISNMDLRGIINLRDFPITAIRSIGASFVGLDLSGAKMQYSSFDKSDFRDCNLTSADLRGSKFIGSKFNRADFTGALMTALKFKKPDGSDRLERVNLSSADLRHATFKDTDLQHAVFMGANLSHTDFSGADVRNADFTGAKLEDAKFTGANIEDAIFDK